MIQVSGQIPGRAQDLTLIKPSSGRSQNVGMRKTEQYFLKIAIFVCSYPWHLLLLTSKQNSGPDGSPEGPLYGIIEEFTCNLKHVAVGCFQRSGNLRDTHQKKGNESKTATGYAVLSLTS